MEFHLNEVQSALKDSSIEVLRDICTPQRNLDMWSRGVAIDEDLWTSLASLGWFGVCVPERHGGLGLGAAELCLIAEQIGYVSAIGPIVPTLAAGAIIGSAPEGSSMAKLLELIAQGERRIAIYVKHDAPILGSMRNSAPQVNWLNDSATVSGTWPFMPWAESADTLLIPVLGPRGQDVIATIGSDSPGLSFQTLSNIDQGTRWSHVSLMNTEVSQGDWLEISGTRASDLNAISSAAEIMGACRRCLDLSLEYAGVRSQFGKLIGTFQAVRHHCADMYVGIENASSVIAHAAAAVDAGLTTASSSAAVAAITAHQVGIKVWTNALQVHGGIGFTWECELHLCIKRIMALQGGMGSLDHHSEMLLKTNF